MSCTLCMTLPAEVGIAGTLWAPVGKVRRQRHRQTATRPEEDLWADHARRRNPSYSKDWFELIAQVPILVHYNRPRVHTALL
jgi:hypothetical protein